jgi:hypothetical protein
MTTKKFSDGAIKDFQVGDRVVWDKAGNSIYEVVKISGEGITISLLESHPQKGSIPPKAKRRVSLDEIEPLDIGSNTQHHAKSSRGFVAGDRIEHSASNFFVKRQVYQELEKCSYNLTSVVGSAQVFPLQDLSLEDSNLKDYAKSIDSVMTDYAIASLKPLSTLTCDRYSSTLKSSKSSLVVRHASPFPLKANVEAWQISVTVSPPSCIPSTQYNQTSLPLKTCQDCSVAPSAPANQLAHISHICSGKFGEAGTMDNGFVSVAATLALPSLDEDYYWLESPGALSSDMSRSPGLSKSEGKWQKSGLLKRGEVANPDFLEQCFGLPRNWTSPQECRPATELLEQDAQRLAIASIPELQVSPFAASFTLIPSVNNYSPLVLEETNSYASVIPLELKSNARERNKKVLGDFSYLAPVIPLELKQQQSLVQEKTDLYAFVIPLELEPEQNLVLGDNQNKSIPLELEPTTKRKASGWLERYTKSKKLKGGAIATYPRVEGEREPNNSEHWYWAYRWEEKRDTAKSDNGYVTRAVSLPKNKVEAVQLAIARKWSQGKILSFIRGDET